MNQYLLIVFGCLAVVSATPVLPSNSIWRGTTMDGVVEQLHAECAMHDAMACMKYRLLHLLDQVLSPAQVSENIEVVENGAEHEGAARSGKADILEQVEQFVKGHDVVAKLPGSYLDGTTLTISPRNLDKDELTLSLQLPSEARDGKAVKGVEARKSKLKKIIIPLLVFVLLKAMTLIPLAIGVLGLKAWNALQLSFFSFVISIALAIFQLCKKIAADASSAQVAAHGPWDNYQAAHYAARSLLTETDHKQSGQELAYNAYSS